MGSEAMKADRACVEQCPGYLDETRFGDDEQRREGRMLLVETEERF